MANFLKISLTVLFIMTFLSCSAKRGNTQNIKTVEIFYDFLSNPGSTSHTKNFADSVTDNWRSIGNYSGKNKSAQAFIGQLKGFSKLIPDLKWQIQSIHQESNYVTVRSRATGTPKGPFFGVDGKGRSFDILTIDIHELDQGKITKTYHVEDWAGALQQLSSPEAKKAKAEQAEGQKSLATVMAFMGAMGSGDMDNMKALMANDMVWHNEGDSNIPWIGPWKGKEQILGFLGKFSTGAKTTFWQNEDVLSYGDTVAIFGKMKLITTASGQETETFTFALRAKVKDNKVVLWNWFEDSYAVSRAFKGQK